MLNAQLKTILANPFPATPITFSITQNGKDVDIVHSFLNTSTSPDKKVSGSIVYNPDVPGATAMVIAGAGLIKGIKTQRLLIKTSSPFGMPLEKTIDFSPVFDSSNTSGNGEPSLYMTITDGLHPNDDIATVNPHFLNIPLMVSPESAVIGSMKQEDITAAIALGLDFKNLLHIATKVAPVVAKAGYEIYKELQKTPTNPSNSVDSFWDTLGSIAKIAVPIAGSLLSE